MNVEAINTIYSHVLEKNSKTDSDDFLVNQTGEGRPLSGTILILSGTKTLIKLWVQFEIFSQKFVIKIVFKFEVKSFSISKMYYCVNTPVTKPNSSLTFLICQCTNIAWVWQIYVHFLQKIHDSLTRAFGFYHYFNATFVIETRCNKSNLIG